MNLLRKKPFQSENTINSLKRVLGAKAKIGQLDLNRSEPS